jgi:4-hydroxybenzoate polyprenyltransferase
MKGGYAWRVISLTSIDVAVGAVVSASVAMHLRGVVIDAVILTVMGLTVWIIYAIDHLMDIWKLVKPASSERHVFFQQYATVLTRLMAFLLFVDGLLVLWLPVRVVVVGALVGVVSLLYLLMQHRLHWVKEIFGAFLFTAGTWLPSMALGSTGIRVVDYFAIVIFLLIALLNLLVFSRHDEQEDRSDQRTSAATQLGRGQLDQWIRLVWILQILICLIAWYNFKYVEELWVLYVMNMLLLIVDIFEPVLKRWQLYRIAADAVFWLPGAFFLVLVH